LPQAPITKASFTERQTTLSTPFFEKSAACSTNPGRWRAEQVGVKAPGSAKSTTFLLAKISSVVSGAGPLSVMCISVAEGTLSPTLIVIVRPRVFVAGR
jgi:hypothetical protein